MTPIDPPDPPAGNSTDEPVDALLTKYREVRTETRERERGIQRQTFVAVIIVGTIFGYAFSTGTL